MKRIKEREGRVVVSLRADLAATSVATGKWHYTTKSRWRRARRDGTALRVTHGTNVERNLT